MNLQQLEYLIALDKTKSFSLAADQCNITQATLSTMVKRLEEELDVVLFDRKSNPIITTECGKEIIELAKLSVNYSHQIKDLAKSVKGKTEGNIRIGIIPTIASSILPFLLKILVEKYPKLNLEIKEITTDYILRQLKDGFLDIGILSTPLNTKKEEFDEEILYYETLYVYGNLATGDKEYLLPNELIDEKVWMLEEGHCLREQTINLCSLNKKITNGNLNFQANSFETLINIVDALGGLTVLPELYVDQLSPERKLKIIPFHTPYPVREVSIISHRPYAKHRIVSILTKEIREYFKPKLLSNNLKNNEQIIVKS